MLNNCWVCTIQDLVAQQNVCSLLKLKVQIPAAIQTYMENEHAVAQIRTLLEGSSIQLLSAQTTSYLKKEWTSSFIDLYKISNQSSRY